MSRRLLKNNKGLTYLLVSSLLVVVLLGIFFAAKKYTYQDTADLYAIKIRAMNDFVKNFNTDIHRATHVSAFRAMIALEDKVASSGHFLTNVSESFKETFYNGTINGTNVEIMQNSSFKDYMAKIQLLANEVGVNLNASIENVELSQSDPWTIDVNITMLLTISDPRSKVAWILHKDFSTSIPIENLRDPLYGVYTLNKLPNTVRICNTTQLVTVANDTDALQLCINQSSYLESDSAPSFLMRFEGNLSQDPGGNGIESIVNVPTLFTQDLPVSWNAIKIDYMYFGNISGNKVCNVQNIDANSHFVIDSSRIDSYQIENLTYSTVGCP